MRLFWVGGRAKGLMIAVSALFLSATVCASAAYADTKTVREDVIVARVRGMQALLATHDYPAAKQAFLDGLKIDPADYSCNLYLAMASLTVLQPRDPKEAVRLLEAAHAATATAFSSHLMGIAADEAGDTALAERARVRCAEELYRSGSADAAFREPDLAWGKAQVLALLKAFPEMKAHFVPGGWLEGWAQGKFAGEGLGTRILFSDERLPWDTSGVSWSDVNFQADMKIALRHANPQEGKFERSEQYWKALIFEMLNDDWRERNYWVLLQALADKDSNKDLALQLRSIEHETDRKMLAFYFEHWKPYCDANKLPSEPGIWASKRPFPETMVRSVLRGKDKTYLDEVPRVGAKP